MSQTNFDHAVLFTFQWEGGLVLDAHDPGGLTNFGIALNKHPELTAVDIKDMTVDQAKEIYRKQYWLPAHCDVMPFPLCIAHFDTAVNRGVHKAAVLLQSVLGISQDGVIGPKTLAAIAAIRDPMKVAGVYIDARERSYKDLVLDVPSMERYLRGWLNRTAALRQEIKRV